MAPSERESLDRDTCCLSLEKKQISKNKRKVSKLSLLPVERRGETHQKQIKASKD